MGWQLPGSKHNRPPVLYPPATARLTRRASSAASAFRPAFFFRQRDAFRTRELLLRPAPQTKLVGDPLHRRQHNPDVLRQLDP